MPLAKDDEQLELFDRRETIAAAFDAVEKADSDGLSDGVKTTTEEPKGDDVATKQGGPDVTTPTKTEATDDAPGSKSLQSLDRAPQAWRAPQKAKWGTLDSDIKQEVLRRERETTQVLNETAQARQFAGQFQQTVQPFMARLQSLNAHPLVAVQELLKADHVLSTAPKQQRAELLAKLITDYDIDIPTLDAVLSGRVPADPVESRVEALLQQRLAPLQQFLNTQQQQTAYQQQEQEQQLNQVVQDLAVDPKFPHFEEVRETMADLIEVAARRRQPLTIEAAYNTAVAMDPALSQIQNARTATQAQTAEAARLNGRAQQALRASVSVKGVPTGSVGSGNSAADRRSTIAAAFESFEGR